MEMGTGPAFSPSGVCWGGGELARGHGVSLFAFGGGPTGLSSLHILTLYGSERVLVVSTEPVDRLRGLAVPETGCCPCR